MAKDSRKETGNESMSTVEEFGSLLQALESEPISGSRNTANRKKRVLKVQEELRSIAGEQSRKFCNCQWVTIAESWHWEEFAAKMEIACPIHGPCRLGVLVKVGGYLSDGDPCDKKLAELVNEYNRRRLAYQKARANCDEV